MADITVRNQGNVSDEGKVNWRGDQVSLTPGDQSIYETSTVQLCDLGSRKVVGDRVFRYAQAGGGVTIAAGDLVQVSPAASANGCLGAVSGYISVTAGTVNQSGGKVFLYYFATSAAADLFAEGYLYSQSGTAANMGQMYRIKSHASVADTTKTSLFLYDPLTLTSNVTDKWSLAFNKYKSVTRATAQTSIAAGVCPVSVTTGDYFWLQTWGPVNVKAGVGVTTGMSVAMGVTGQVEGVTVVTGSVNAPIAWAMQTLTVSERGLVWLTIAP